MTNWSNKLLNLSKREKISAVLVLGLVVILIGVLVWALTTKKLSPKADVVNQITNTATGTYKDASNNNYEAASNPVTVFISSLPVWQNTFNTTAWALASFPHTADKPVGEIFDLSQSQLISGNLHRWDAVGQGYVTFFDFNPGPFGNISWKDGIWVNFEVVPKNIFYQSAALPDNVDQFVDLKPGWNMIGYPFTNSMLLDDVNVQQLDADGIPTGEIRTFLEVQNDWIQDPVMGYDPVDVQGYVAVGTTANTLTNIHLLGSWNGYWVNVYSANGVRLIYPYSAQIQAGGQAVPQGESTTPTDTTKQKKKK